jgi:nitrate reductase delta subunit
MVATLDTHERAARLLSYPVDGDGGALAREAELLAQELPELKSDLERFADAVRSADAGTIEEFYTSAFDNTPDRALELGWHAFGETYSRGSFLASMRARMRDAGVAECIELPDHITHILRLLPHLDPALAAALADGVLVQATDKAIKGFSDTAHPWLAPLKAARAVMASHVATSSRAKEQLHA